jgi:hypothetical protein
MQSPGKVPGGLSRWFNWGACSPGVPATSVGRPQTGSVPTSTRPSETAIHGRTSPSDLGSGARPSAPRLRQCGGTGSIVHQLILNLGNLLIPDGFTPVTTSLSPQKFPACIEHSGRCVPRRVRNLTGCLPRCIRNLPGRLPRCIRYLTGRLPRCTRYLTGCTRNLTGRPRDLSPDLLRGSLQHRLYLRR